MTNPNLEELRLVIREELDRALLSSRTILTPREAAKYLSISLGSIYKLTSAGILTYSKPNNKLIYFDTKDLDEYMLSNRTKSAAQIETEACTFIATNKLTR